MSDSVDRLLGEITAGIENLGRSVDTLRVDQTSFAGRVEASHTAIHESVSDLNATVTGIEEGHNERIKANKEGISLIWKVLLSTGLIGLLVTGAVKAMT